MRVFGGWGEAGVVILKVWFTGNLFLYHYIFVQNFSWDSEHGVTKSDTRIYLFNISERNAEGLCGD